MKTSLILSCEHAVATIPQAWQPCFAPWQDLLASHRGIDFGAQAIAQALHQALHAPLVEATASRLLIDCNRSLNHPQCFSEATQGLSPEAKQQIIRAHYDPFRQAVTALIAAEIEAGQVVLHLSIHSFTPVLNGQIRQADIGLLYDPRRPGEKRVAQTWQKILQQQAPQWRIRRNYPYQGKSDGFTTYLRKQFSPENYIGIEVESNQALTTKSEQLDRLKNCYIHSLRELFLVITS